MLKMYTDALLRLLTHLMTQVFLIRFYLRAVGYQVTVTPMCEQYLTTVTYLEETREFQFLRQASSGMVYYRPSLIRIHDLIVSSMINHGWLGGKLKTLFFSLNNFNFISRLWFLVQCFLFLACVLNLIEQHGQKVEGSKHIDLACRTIFSACTCMERTPLYQPIHSKQKYSPNYRRVLKHRILQKRKTLTDDLLLINEVLDKLQSL